MFSQDINTKPTCKDGDAAYLEQWLINQHGDIIELFSKFQEMTGWKETRCNATFHYIFVNSQRVGW